MHRVTSVVLALAVGAFALAARASVPDESVDAFYDATLEIENAEGWRVQRYLNPDMTFTQTGSGGVVRGTWEVADGRLCTTQREPRRPTNHPKTFCNTGARLQGRRQVARQGPADGQPHLLRAQAGPLNPSTPSAAASPVAKVACSR